jgi:alkyl hydroperoxide reductase subunit AhpC
VPASGRRAAACVAGQRDDGSWAEPTTNSGSPNFRNPDDVGQDYRYGALTAASTRSTDKGDPDMAIHLGDTAPDFTAQTTQGEINFHEFLGDSWGVLFSHPKDFTPVCTTELGYVAKIKPEFDKRNVKVIGLSVDPVASHVEWEGDIEETQGTAVNFPMIGDPDREISTLYDMIHENANDTLTVRSVFVIGPDKKVKLTLTYPASTGRNFDEILRVIDSLQLTADHKVATPVNWTDGDDVIIVPALSDDEAKALFPNGWNPVKPYLRVTKQPNR